MSDGPRLYSFGPYVLEPARGILRRHGIRVPLTPRMVDLLAVFVSQAGDVLHKDEIIRRVWGGTVVEENNLARQVSSLRKALGETAGSREYIATVPGVGYRFVAPVHVAAEPIAEVPPPVAVSGAWLRRPAFVIIGLALVGIVVVGLMAARNAAQAGDLSSVQRSMSQFTFGGGLQQDPTWSPDGKRLAFASDRSGSMDLWIQTIGEAEPARVTSSPDRDWQPSWSPDGMSLVFRSGREGGGLFIVPAAGGEPRRISTFGDRPLWSPRGDLILFSNATVRTGARKLYVVEPGGGVPREIRADVMEPFISSSWVSSVEAAWHPGGRRVSIWGRLGADRWAFATVPLSGGDPVYSEIPESALRAIEESHVRLGRFTWGRSGTFLYFEGQTGDVRNIWRVGIDPTTLAWRSAPERLTTDVGEEADIALSPDGTRLAFTVRAERTRVWSLDFDPHAGRLTGPELALTPVSSGQVDVDTLPDGSRLAYRALRAGRNEMREFTTSSRRDRILLVSSEWSPSMPRWSSDGRWLAYARPSGGADPGKTVVAVLSPDERQEQLVALQGNATMRPSDWSRDGRTILGDCRIAPGQPMGICSIPAPGQDAVEPSLKILLHDASRNLYGPRLSPDQRWVSFVAVDVKGSTTSQLFAAPVDGGPWVPLTDGRSFADKPRWSPDGHALYFVSDRNGYLNLNGRRFDAEAGGPIGDVFPVTSFDNPRRGLPPNIAQIEFAVTHHRLFLPLTDTEADIWILDHVDR